METHMPFNHYIVLVRREGKAFILELSNTLGDFVHLSFPDSGSLVSLLELAKLKAMHVAETETNEGFPTNGS